MAAINKAWHARNPMPAPATLDERVAWHVAHAEACGCRPMPAGIAAVIAQRGASEGLAELAIAPLKKSDEAEWRALFEAYSRFYKVKPSPAKTDTVWRWLMDPRNEVTGLGGRADGRLVAFAHVRPVPHSLSGAMGGFLDDLYVDPSVRGSGAAARMIGAVAAYARAQKWYVVNWLTADDNYRARGLYDRVGRKTPWNTYELDPNDKRFD